MFWELLEYKTGIESNNNWEKGFSNIASQIYRIRRNRKAIALYFCS